MENNYAGFWMRFGAILIDSIIVGIVNFIISMVLGKGAVTSLVSLVIGWLYFALLESSDKQGTVGKMALGIQVTDLNGERVSFGKATGRYFGKIISSLILCIGYIMAAFTEKKQALHDMMAGTLVVRK